jgi:hypothetical protein
LDRERAAVAEVGKADRERAGAEESTALEAFGMPVSRPAAGGLDLEAAALAEVDLAAVLEEVQAAVAAGVDMAPVGDMALEAVEQVLGVVVATDPAEVDRGRGVAMGLAAVEGATAPGVGAQVVVEAPEREPVTAAELEMGQAAGPVVEEKVGERVLDLAEGDLVAALDPEGADQEVVLADMGLVKAAALGVADRVDPDSDLVEAVLAQVQVAEVDLDRVPAADLGVVDRVDPDSDLVEAALAQVQVAEVDLGRVPAADLGVAVLARVWAVAPEAVDLVEVPGGPGVEVDLDLAQVADLAAGVQVEEVRQSEEGRAAAQVPV